MIALRYVVSHIGGGEFGGSLQLGYHLGTGVLTMGEGGNDKTMTFVDFFGLVWSFWHHFFHHSKTSMEEGGGPSQCSERRQPLGAGGGQILAVNDPVLLDRAGGGVERGDVAEDAGRGEPVEEGGNHLGGGLQLLHLDLGLVLAPDGPQAQGLGPLGPLGQGLVLLNQLIGGVGGLDNDGLALDGHRDGDGGHGVQGGGGLDLR